MPSRVGRTYTVNFFKFVIKGLVLNTNNNFSKFYIGPLIYYSQIRKPLENQKRILHHLFPNAAIILLFSRQIGSCNRQIRFHLCNSILRVPQLSSQSCHLWTEGEWLFRRRGIACRFQIRLPRLSWFPHLLLLLAQTVLRHRQTSILHKIIIAKCIWDANRPIFSARPGPCCH